MFCIEEIKQGFKKIDESFTVLEQKIDYLQSLNNKGFEDINLTIERLKELVK